MLKGCPGQGLYGWGWGWSYIGLLKGLLLFLGNCLIEDRQPGLWSPAGQGAALWEGQMREAAPHRLSAGLLLRRGHQAWEPDIRIQRPC